MAQQGAAWLSRVRHGSVRVRHGSVGSVSGCCKAAPSSISARHPSGDPLPELAAMKKLERNSANVMNECVCMNLYECTVNNEEN